MWNSQSLTHKTKQERNTPHLTEGAFSHQAWAICLYVPEEIPKRKVTIKFWNCNYSNETSFFLTAGQVKLF